MTKRLPPESCIQLRLIRPVAGIAVLILLQLTLFNSACYAGDTNSSGQEFKKLQSYNQLTFIPNMGQIVDMKRHPCPDVLYKGKGSGADIYLRKTGISYVYSNIKRTDKSNSGDTSGKERIYKLHRVDMDFAGCNSSITTLNEDAAEGYNNYYLAQCPKGILNVKEYKKVIFKNVYNNIDVVFYGNEENAFKYDIIIKPHANAKQVKLNWSGAEAMHLNDAGDLVIKTSANEFYESIPKVYQEINGKTILVEAHYALKSASSNSSKMVTFVIGNYNHEFPLIVDPLTWITYFGGNMEDFGASVVTDRQHNVIFEGYTESPNLPVSPGAMQTILDGFSDGFVAKFNSAGTRLWATYIGGSAKDEARGGIAVDTNNNIYISSVTWSTDFPVKAWGSAFMQLVNNSPNNGTAYVAQLTPAGTLTWATYYGGSVADWGADITIDKAGNIIFAGQTSSANFPVLNAYQATLRGNTNAFIVKFNNSGIRQWATFYGGNGSEQTWGIATDTANNIYVCGKTSSTNFPVVAAFQGVYGGGANDAFFIKLNTANGNPLWATYYGGSGDDWGTAVAADALGNIFLGLFTASANNISTPGSYQPVNAGGSYDGGIVKFTIAGARVWSTYMGGNQEDGVTGLAVDKNNNISVGGLTFSSNFPVTNCAFQKTLRGTTAITLAKFNQQDQLLCSTYIDNSSTGPATGGCIAIDGAYAYINGNSTGNLPVTSGCFQSTYGGTGALGDAAFLKLCSYSCDTAGGTSVLANFNAVPATPCLGEPVNFTLSNVSCDTSNTTYSWTFTGGTPVTSALQNPAGIIWNSSGTHSVSVKIVSPCDSTTISNAVVVPQAINASINSTNASCGNNNGSATITNTSGGISPYTYSWMPSGGTNTTASNLSAGTYTCLVTDQNGCSNTTTVTINNTNGLTITTSPNVTINSGQTIVLSATGGGTYTWSPATGLSCATCPNPSATPSQTTQYCVLVDSAGCKDSSCITITVNTELPCGDFFVPDAFSPGNRNGKNTVFYVIGNCVISLDLYIYDRWGNKVFYSNNIQKGWDGTYNGQPMDVGTYVWYLKATLEDGSQIERKGNVTLVK